MSELLNQLRIAHRESAEACIAGHLEKLGFVGLRPEARKTAEAAVSATLEEIEAFLQANAQEPPDEAEKSIDDLKAGAIKTAANKVFATLEKIADHLEKMGLLGSRPPAQEPTSEAEKSLADIKAEITATLEEVKAHIRANAKEGQAPAPDIATQASQQEQAVPPKEEPEQDSHYAAGRDFFNLVFDRALKKNAFGRLDEAARASQQEQATPACHPQLLRAFGLLMRRVGTPPEGAPGPVQKAVMDLAEVLAEGSEVSVKDFFDRAHRADIEARWARLEAKIAQTRKTTK